MRSWMTGLTAVLGLAIIGGAGYLELQTRQAGGAQKVETAPPTVAVTVCDVERTVTAPGNLANTKEIDLQMPADGQLEEILVQAGQAVKSGQALARLANPEKFAAQVAAAELELLQAKQALENLQAGALKEQAEAQLALANAQEAVKDAQRNRTRLDYPRADALVIEAAGTDYALAKLAYEEAQKAYDKVAHKRVTDPERAMALEALLATKTEMERALALSNWFELEPTEAEIDKADAELAVAQAALAEARARWERLINGPDPLEVALAEGRVALAEANLTAVQEVFSSVELQAPFDGVVVEVKARPGENLTAGTPLLVINDPGALEVEATVIEEDLPSIEVGQTAEVFFDAAPEAQAQGQVSRIVPQRVPGDRPLYSIYITLDSVPAEVVVGMTADASITIAETQDALCLPRSLVRASSGDTAIVKVWVDRQALERTIRVGLRGDVTIEILSGLEEGELVLQ